MSELELTIGPQALQILKLLAGNLPKTSDQLARTMSLSRTAVTFHLEELMRMGLVACQQHRQPNRGRPRNFYGTTEAALALLFAAGHRRILPMIWEAVADCGGAELVHQVMTQLCDKLVATYSGRIRVTEPSARLKKLVELLHKEGVLIEVAVTEEHLTIRRRSCPFVTMADKDFAICDFDTRFFASVLGCKVQKIACRRKGDPCCVFEVLTED